MKAYIISSYDCIPIAEKLLKGIKGLDIDLEPVGVTGTRNISAAVQSTIKRADVILTIIDENFAANEWLNASLKWALDSVRKHKNKVFIPVILDDAAVPPSVEGMLYISCKSSDLVQATYSINKILALHMITGQKRLSKNNRFKSVVTPVIIGGLTIVVTVFMERIIEADLLWSPLDVIELTGIIIVSSFVIWELIFFAEESSTEQIESYSKRLRETIVPYIAIQGETEPGGITEKNAEIDALGRMMINLEDIKEFYTWSQKQAKASFGFAAGMCIFGSILMLIAIILPLTLKMSFEMSIIPAIGGVITELIAGTALVVYRNSLQQLNHYHEALHEDERFLSSVNLLGKFSTIEVQDEMLKEIIRSEIQMNLASIDKIERVMESDGEKKEKL